jgi:hypothetical protein
MIYGSRYAGVFTGLATQVVYGGCDADTADFYSKASGTATTDANQDDPNSYLRQRPLLTVDEVITPQVGNSTIFARYVEVGFATQVVLNARLTRFYEREDWNAAPASRRGSSRCCWNGHLAGNCRGNRQPRNTINSRQRRGDGAHRP